LYFAYAHPKDPREVDARDLCRERIEGIGPVDDGGQLAYTRGGLRQQ
jgi:hypothetical protein